MLLPPAAGTVTATVTAAWPRSRRSRRRTVSLSHSVTGSHGSRESDGGTAGVTTHGIMS
jgi:hypothetical protein